MKQLLFFEYLYYLKPNFLPLHLPEYHFFRQPETDSRFKKEGIDFQVQIYHSITRGVPHDQLKDYFASQRYEYNYDCYHAVFDNIRFIKVCFGWKHLLYVLYIRTLIHPLKIFEWIIVPFALLCSFPKKERLCFSEPNVDISPDNNSISIAVVIPTKDRHQLVLSLLNQVNKQTFLPSEVIVIDQSATYIPIVQKWPNIHVQHIYHPEGGQVSARNKGIELSTASFILSLDDDCEIDETFIEQHATTFLVFPDADASAGPYYSPFEKSIIPRQSWSPAHHLPGGNSLIRKSVFSEVGAYNPITDRHYLSDTELFIRFIQNKKKIVYNHHAVLRHLEYPMGGLKHYSHNKSRQLLTINLPNSREIAFFRGIVSNRWMNAWFIQHCVTVFNKKITRHRLKHFKHICLFVMLPVWQIMFLLNKRKMLAHES